MARFSSFPFMEAEKIRMTCGFMVGEWLVEPDLNRITGANSSIAIEPKVLEVLLCLAKRPGEVFSKDAILRAVWPGTFVSQGILSYSISQLRRIFDDSAKNPRIIQTIARKGYRLIAPVKPLAPVPGTQPSVAVLPFTDMTEGKDQEWFCDGIADEIIHHLACGNGLCVSSRTSSFRYKDEPAPIARIGAELGVAAVLEGSLRKAGRTWRVASQLIEVEGGRRVWSDRFDRTADDGFEVQDELSLLIAEQVKAALLSETSPAI
jgi:adenylate cyclase